MRLFVSINVPEKLHDYCRSLQKQYEDFRKVYEFHLTLHFLGDGIDEVMETKIIEALQQISFVPFEVRLGNVRPFGPSGRPRGIWIDCEETPELMGLADEVRGLLSALGFETDKPFRPHITLGRYKKLPKQIPKMLLTEKKSFFANQFYLMQSHLETEGVQYKVKTSFPSQA